MSPERTGSVIPDFDRELVKSILGKMGRSDRYTTNSQAALTFGQLYERLNAPETQVIQQLLEINPSDVGFYGPFVSKETPLVDLAALTDQSFVKNGKNVVIANQYLPKQVLQAFLEMQRAIKADLGSNLMVESGFRSPAHQAITFLTYLELHNFDVKSTARGVALPEYSQHSDTVNTALDVINQDGIPTDEEPQLFANTKEFRWLTKNAEQFDFHLSYPEGNELGVKYEPWHWQYTA